ncbi:MAG: ACT domain-containing protein [Kangiellaceae bacterium]|jgi:glycine cleavage system regulatory protein|nr:ACT domain-containing protein [Kangiellaceae bacterium]
MKEKLLITLVGDDKPGLIEQLSDVVRLNHGNWLESRLSHLGGQFSGLILAEFLSEDLEQAIEALSELTTQGLSVSASPSQIKPIPDLLNIQVVGNDKPGIINEISQALYRAHANVESLQTEVEPAPMSGGMLFKAHMQVSLPTKMTAADLQKELETVANDLMIDFTVD